MKRTLWEMLRRDFSLSFTRSGQNVTLHILKVTIAALVVVIAVCLMSGNPRPVVLITLVLYTAYSLVVLLIALRGSAIPILRDVSPWADVCCYSLRRGYAPAVSAIVLSVGSLILADYLLLLGWAKQPERLLIHCLYLLSLGHLMAHCGGYVVILKRRLALLREVTSLSNLRFGVDRTVGSIIEQLRRFHAADTCLLVTCDPTTANYSLRLADGRNRESAILAQPIEPAFARQLLSLPKELAVSYDATSRHWPRSHQRCVTYDVTTGKGSVTKSEMLEDLAPLLDAVAMMSVPLNYSQSLNGRLYLLFRDGSFCGESDLSFLHHVIKHVMPLIANIRLMDQLVINAATEERRKVARDIHDSVLQPFLGLRLGLAALKQTMGNGQIPSASTIDQLVEMNDFGIEELRTYLTALRSSKKREDTLVPAVKRFATRFSQVTGIDVQVEAKGDVRVSERLAEEAVRIVAEGLSNVNRHTQSERATAGIECRDDHLVMRIGNDAAGPGEEPPKFFPKSISERARAAGGQAWVEADGHSGTAVVVKIPL